jgi:predicted transcriptional regulator/transcriptional regulator with XRE-family HTH domain
MTTPTRLGRKLRALRQAQGLTQSALAGRLGISAGYINLIEHDRRPLTAALLLRLGQLFEIDLQAFAAGGDAQVTADALEVFGDPLFQRMAPSEGEIQDFAASHPAIARAVVRLHHAYLASRGSAESLAAQVAERQDAGAPSPVPPSEQVSDLIERHGNHFPELEEEAERVWTDGGLEREDLYGGLAGYLERTFSVRVRIEQVGAMHGATRRYDADRRELLISELLRRGTRNSQLAHQIGLMRGTAVLDRLSRDPELASDEARALARVALANYFAGAVLMPYAEFHGAAEAERYDLELLGHRFRSSFEQVCHRLTTLQRRGARGIPFHMVRVDIAGNISKKFSPAGDLRFPRFGGLCPLWNVHAAFLQPGMIRAQLSKLPDGTRFFSVARTVRKPRGGWHAPDVLNAIGLGCDTVSARRLVYADGVDLDNVAAAVPVGITCRLCERVDCEARAFPSLRHPLQVDENVRGLSFFAPVPARPPREPERPRDTT